MSTSVIGLSIDSASPAALAGFWSQVLQRPVNPGADAENAVNRAVSALVAVAEGYPQLKASRNFLQLQTELVDTEDRIAAGRRFYNGNVRAYNTRVESVPSNLIAARFHFTAADYFPLDDPTARQAIAVQLP